MCRWIRIQNRWSRRSRCCPQRRIRNSWWLQIIKSQSRWRSCHHQKIIKIKKCRTHQRPHHQKKRKIWIRYRCRCLLNRPSSRPWMSWILRWTLRRRRIFPLINQTHQQSLSQRRLNRCCHPLSPSPRSPCLSRFFWCLSWCRSLS